MKLKPLRKSAAMIWAEACKEYERDVAIIEALEAKGFVPFRTKIAERNEWGYYEPYMNEPSLRHWLGDKIPFIIMDPENYSETEYYLYHLQEIFPGHFIDFNFGSHEEFKMRVSLGGYLVDIRVDMPYELGDNCTIGYEDVEVPATTDRVRVIRCNGEVWKKDEAYA